MTEPRDPDDPKRPIDPVDPNLTTRYEPPIDAEPVGTEAPPADASSPEAPPSEGPPADAWSPETPPPSPGVPPVDPTWQPRAPDQGRTASILFGLVMLGVGLWFFADQTLGLELPRIRWSQLWPLVLILIGGWIAVGAMRRGR